MTRRGKVMPSACSTCQMPGIDCVRLSSIKTLFASATQTAALMGASVVLMRLTTSSLYATVGTASGGLTCSHYTRTAIAASLHLKAAASDVSASYRTQREIDHASSVVRQ